MGKGPTMLRAVNPILMSKTNNMQLVKCQKSNMPQFVHENIQDLTEQSNFGIPCEDYMEQYQALGWDFRVAMSFTYLCHLHLKIRS